jgi:hypothetical protein
VQPQAPLQRDAVDASDHRRHRAARAAGSQPALVATKRVAGTADVAHRADEGAGIAEQLDLMPGPQRQARGIARRDGEDGLAIARDQLIEVAAQI